MDQSEADWGDWSLNNDGGTNSAVESDIKVEPIDDEQRLTSYDTQQGDPSEFKFYDDDNGNLSGGSMDTGGSEEEDDDLSQSAVRREHLHQPQSMGINAMVMCEFCGKLGVRDAFYSKTKRFCSVNCSKSFSAHQKDGKPTPFSMMKVTVPRIQPSTGKRMFSKSAQVVTKQGNSKTFDWSEYIDRFGGQAAPVSCFKHCPMSDSWDNIAVGMKVEVVNTDCGLPTTAYWIATVIKLAGYRAQMRYEGFGTDPARDFWINLCTKGVHPVGWCAANRQPLVPPQTIQHKYDDWKDFLVKRLTGARTLPQNFGSKLQQCIEDVPLKKGMRVEVVDKMCVSAMKVAKVEEVVGGRLRLQYEESKFENDEFWCHSNSDLIHPVGWSQMVGHKLHASSDYKTESLNKAALKAYCEKDASPDMFVKLRDPPTGQNGVKFHSGMKLEAIDPLNLSSICVATVMKVLRNNYLMIGVDGSMAENGSDWFCFHATSPCIFPVGFCEINSLELAPPRGYKGQFKWFDYLRQCKATAAPVKLFDKEIPRHGFKSCMKLEAVDLMEPRLICVATVRKVVGRLLRVHFDGWDDTYDQWVDCQSSDIYPVGWSEMVGYHLEGPRPKEPVAQPIAPAPKKRKSKSQMYRGPRKKRKPRFQPPHAPQSSGKMMSARLLSGRHSSIDSSDVSQDSFAPSLGDSSTSHGKSPGIRAWETPRLGDVASSVGLEDAHRPGVPARAAGRPSLSSESRPPGVGADLKPAVMPMPGAAVIAADGVSAVGRRQSLSPLGPVLGESGPPRTSGGGGGGPTSSADPTTTSNSAKVLVSKSSLAASLPSIVNMLNAPVQPADQPPAVTTTSSRGGGLSSPTTPTAPPPVTPTSVATAAMTGPVQGSPGRGAVTTSSAGAVGAPPARQGLSLAATVTLSAPPGSSFTLQKLAGSGSGAGGQSPVYSLTTQSLAATSSGSASPGGGGGGCGVAATGAESPTGHQGLSHVVSHNIPRVIPGDPDRECVGPMTVGKAKPIIPDQWTVFDVCQFLRINDCGAHCDSFRKKNIDGIKFMALTKEQIVNLTGMKVGPSLKIYDLIQALKITVASQQGGAKPRLGSGLEQQGAASRLEQPGILTPPRPGPSLDLQEAGRPTGGGGTAVKTPKPGAVRGGGGGGGAGGSSSPSPQGQQQLQQQQQLTASSLLKQQGLMHGAVTVSKASAPAGGASTTGKSNSVDSVARGGSLPNPGHSMALKAQLTQ